MEDAAKSQRISAQNSQYFIGNEDYSSRVSRMRTYRNIRGAIDESIIDVNRLLDIGSGGVFDYNVQLVPEIVGIDLFLDLESQISTPINVTLKSGNALNLPEDSQTYDGVLIALVLHHLTEESAGPMMDNVRRALAEAKRVLRPGGQLIVVESCVAKWFYLLEKVLFRPLVLLSRTRVMRHPPTMQLPIHVLEQLVAEEFGSVKIKRIPLGPTILQFGRKWPSLLTPARPWRLVATR